MPVLTLAAAILRVPRNNTSLVTNEEQATSSTYGAAESNVRRRLLELKTEY